jgi:succinate dehydrogenase (ubiquinone) cytochrome b560 subunit
VTIYAFPFPAIVSVSNRFAGVALAAGFWAAGAASLVCPTAIPVVWGFLKASPILLAMAKAAIAFPLSFHYFAGIRHLVWDNTNWGLDSVEAVERSSMVLVGSTTVVTVAAALL